ncbi:MAG: hypothetical protein SFU98_04895 [Leptospiraceae bacterium]|nr:hypothetical protein [Leptospiraceae bacterium]
MKLLLLTLIFVFSNCTKEKDKSLIQQLTEFSVLSVASSSSKCSINSSNNSNYFQAKTTPQGGNTIVNRLNAKISSDDVEVYYPESTSKDLPVVVLYQGGNVHASFYSKFAARIASSNYAVYVVNRCSVFIIQYFLYPSSSLSNEIYELAKKQNTDTTSVLLGRLNPERIGIIGHSLGGVIGQFSMNGICEVPFCNGSVSRLSQEKVGIFYGSGLGESFNKSRYYVDSTGKGIPTAYIQGSRDSAYVPDTAEKNYANSISPKYLVTVEGTNHYGINDGDNPFGANQESNRNTIEQTLGIERISLISIEFLNAYTKLDANSIVKINSNTLGITGVSSKSSP